MRCHQCERPAFYRLTENAPPLCVACADVAQSIEDRRQSIVDRQWLQNAAMLNLSLDEMDAAVGGICPSSGRVPVDAIARVMMGNGTLNNIHVTNSNVGLLNTGNVRKIDAAITIAQGTDADQIAHQLRQLTQAILDVKGLESSRKDSLLELVQSLSDQIVRERKQSVIMALLKSIEDRAQGLAAISTIVEGLTAAIRNLFG
jgi:hypothetical protein